MKRVHLTQTYELTMTVNVDTPDDYTNEDIVNALTDFPVNATVESMWAKCPTSLSEACAWTHSSRSTGAGLP